jgi:hypothetical protein
MAAQFEPRQLLLVKKWHFLNELARQRRKTALSLQALLRCLGGIATALRKFTHELAVDQAAALAIVIDSLGRSDR